MRIQTFSIIAGSEACNARCPFCISKMTIPHGLEPKEPEVDWRNFEVACRFAKQNGCTTAMLTGKGEPTLFPNQITMFLKRLEPHKFPFIELQTNGIRIAEKTNKYLKYLQEWYELWMTTIAISIVHFEPEKNRQIYLPYEKNYIDLPRLIKLLREQGFSVRLTCILAKDFIDSSDKVKSLIQFAKENNAGQLTLTPVNKPEEELSQNKEAWDWTAKHHLTDEQWNDIKHFVQTNGVKLMHLVHGAVVFDVWGQNVCLNNCLSVQADSEDMRNLIFYPNGDLGYYWQYAGALLLQGKPSNKC